MSRCFPYPPPGYERKGASSGAALIESIKLQSESKKVKTDTRKEKKRDKNHKRKGRKDKSGVVGHDEVKLNLKRDHKHEKRMASCETLRSKKVNGYEAEQLERSDLTEEHGQPMCLQNPCYSSESIQSGGHKRKRRTNQNDNCERQTGTVIRIRLSMKKQTDPEQSIVEEEISPSQHGNDIIQVRNEEKCCSINDTTNLAAETRASTAEIDLPCLGGTGSGAPASDNRIQEADSPYKALIENWVPPQHIFTQNDSSDLDWLFGKSSFKNGQSPKRRKAFNDGGLCCRSTSLLPRAQHLPEADIYALPFTIPY